MTDKKGIIRTFGTKLEEKIREGNLTPQEKELLSIGMEFGYAVGGCERDFDYKNDAYSATKCLRRYENIKKLLEGK